MKRKIAFLLIFSGISVFMLGAILHWLSLAGDGACLCIGMALGIIGSIVLVSYLRHHPKFRDYLK